MTSLDDKKNFLSWVVEYVTFKEKESYWILNYLINHDGILNRVSFVDHADQTPRGLVISDSESDSNGLVLFKNNHQFNDAQQIFHDIRMCYKDSLYLDIRFNKREMNQLYLSVIEDNPFISVFDTVSPKMKHALHRYFQDAQNQAELKMIEEKIDLAIDEENQEAFKEWSAKYSQKKNQK